MHERPYLDVFNQKKDSPIKAIFSIPPLILINLSLGDDNDEDVKNIIRLLAKHLEPSVQPLDSRASRMLISLPNVDIKEIILPLGLKYLSLSVFKEFGISDAKLQQAGILPKSLVNISLDFIEKSQQSKLGFWSQEQLKQLPTDIKEMRPSIDPKTKFECEISADLYRSFYCT